MIHTYTIADITIRITSRDAGFLDSAARRHKAAIENDGPVSLEVYLETAIDVSKLRRFQVSPGPNGELDFLMDGVYCRMEPERGAAFLRIVPDVSVYEYVLQILFSGVLVQSSGGIFHAAGLIHDGRGYLFAGRPGAGKSTVSAMPAAHEVTDDDTAIVRQAKNGTFYIYPTPAWMGNGNQSVWAADRAPLSACFILHQDSRTFIEKVEPVSQVGQLFDNLRFVLPEQRVIDSALEFLDTFRRRVRTAVLHFALNDGERIWNVIDRYLGKEI